MNVYDFDYTIYHGDSTADFYKFCLKKHKKIALLLPSLAIAFIKYYWFKIGTKTQFKEKMYKFLKYCDTQKDVEDFWNIHKYKFKKFYIDQKKDDDVVISASPTFLLKPLEEQFGFTVIASIVDEKNGKYTGINCYYEEKVRRFREVFPDGVIENFYSDHYSDEPLAKISNKAYIVENENITEWNFDIHHTPKL